MLYIVHTDKLNKLRTICNGEENCCSEAKPCGEMEGDCNSDKDCLIGLKCGENNCNENSGNWESTDDCCYKPKGSYTGICIFIFTFDKNVIGYFGYI